MVPELPAVEALDDDQAARPRHRDRGQRLDPAQDLGTEPAAYPPRWRVAGDHRPVYRPAGRQAQGDDARPRGK